MGRLTTKNFRPTRSVKQIKESMLLEMYDKLAHYEDLEEQGRLIELPCAVGDTVWCVDEDYIHEGYIHAVAQDESTLWVSARYTSGLRYDHPSRDIGEDVFLTKEEAEAKLKEVDNG